MAATSALEDTNTSTCQGTISMPTFNCNCNNPQNKPAECPDSPQTCEASSYASPAQSCEEVARSKPHQLPTYQWIKHFTFHPVMVYCIAATQCCSKGDLGWMNVVDFDKINPNQHCPSDLASTLEYVAAHYKYWRMPVITLPSSYNIR